MHGVYFFINSAMLKSNTLIFMGKGGKWQIKCILECITLIKYHRSMV